MAEIFDPRPLNLIAEQAIEDMMRTLFSELESSLMSAIEDIETKVEELQSHLGC